jgi:putative ABC transport system permease protein
MEGLRRDIRFALRSLRRSRGFTLAALTCVALAIGANAAVFSVVRAVLLQPLPYPQPQRLVMLWGHVPGEDDDELPASGAEFVDYRDRLESFEAVSAIVNRYVNLTGEGEPRRLTAARVSHSFFPILGVHPEIGRAFLPEEDRRGNEKVVVLSNGLWRRQFGADEGIVGDKILLSDEPFTVVGVMPASFDFRFELFEHDLWIPVAIDWDHLPPRDFRGLRVLGRLAPDATIEQARTEADTLAASFLREHPDVYSAADGWRLRVVPLIDQVVGDVRASLFVLLGMVALVLLIACANVTNLFLARAAERRKEVAIRTSIGARRLELVRQSLVESVLLALAGAAIGLLLASWGLEVLQAMEPENLPRLAEVSIDGGVLLFTFVVAVVAGLLFGAVPALRASRPDLQGTLKEGGKTDDVSGGAARLRRALVVGEIALALLVLVSAGLMLRSLGRLEAESPGFETGGVLTADLYLSPTRHAPGPEMVAFGERILDLVRRTPGVAEAGAVTGLPLSNVQFMVPTEVEGDVRGEERALPSFDWRPITPGYLEAIGVPVVAGRTFDDRDHAGAQPVAIVSEDLAERYWPGQDPLGKRLMLTVGQPNGPEWRTVIGVTEHVKAVSLDGESPEQVYTPVAQSPTPFFSLAIRTDPSAGGDPMAVAPAVRKAIWSAERDQPIENLRPMEEIVEQATAGRRAYAFLITVFSVVALVLAVVGVYGVMAYSVAQRTTEIGLRMALGAEPGDVLRLVAGQGAALAGIGLAVGLLVSFWTGRFLSGLLYGVSARDPLTYAAVAVALGALALIATVIPARRATRVDPIASLRSD